MIPSLTDLLKRLDEIERALFTIEKIANHLDAQITATLETVTKLEKNSQGD
jgi:predicted metalloprotease